MNRTEYEALTKTPSEPDVITGDQLENRKPRTLLYGYTLERHTFHVYLDLNGFIHVLVYREVSNDPETGAERYLILDHAGIGGRELKSNDEFLPSKRAYPESTDFEFARLLRRAEKYPSFTTFTDGADEARKGETEDFAGKTHNSPYMLEGKQMGDSLYTHPKYVELAKNDKKLAARLICQASNDLGIAADVDSGTVIVAVHGADAVLQKATEYLESITVPDVQSSSFASDLVNAVYGYGHYILPGRPDLCNGRVIITFDPEKAQFVNNSSFKRYSKTNFKGAEAIIGEIEGMPFVAAPLNEDSVWLEVLQFGDRQRCIEQWMRTFSLAPISKKKDKKTVASS